MLKRDSMGTPIFEYFLGQLWKAWDIGSRPANEWIFSSCQADTTHYMAISRLLNVPKMTAKQQETIKNNKNNKKQTNEKLPYKEEVPESAKCPEQDRTNFSVCFALIPSPKKEASFYGTLPITTLPARPLLVWHSRCSACSMESLALLQKQRVSSRLW